jgi:hypothetical protein
MLADGNLPARGFVRQEDIGLDDFLENRFGCQYAVGVARQGLQAKLREGEAFTGDSPARQSNT